MCPCGEEGVFSCQREGCTNLYCVLCALKMDYDDPMTCPECNEKGD